MWMDIGYDLKWALQPPVMESKELDGGARHPGAVGQGEVGEPGEANRNLKLRTGWGHRVMWQTEVRSQMIMSVLQAGCGLPSATRCLWGSCSLRYPAAPKVGFAPQPDKKIYQYTIRWGPKTTRSQYINQSYQTPPSNFSYCSDQ